MKVGRTGNQAFHLSPVLSRQREIGRDSLIHGPMKYILITSVVFVSAVLVLGVLILVSLAYH